jgi:hypothetical protein
VKENAFLFVQQETPDSEAKGIAQLEHRFAVSQVTGNYQSYLGLMRINGGGFPFSRDREGFRPGNIFLLDGCEAIWRGVC